MTPERYARLQELFEAAAELSPHQRVDFLDRECAADDELRREVEVLLAADEQGDLAVENLAPRALADLFPKNGEDHFVGQKFGAYEILRELGRGGLGAVFLAARADDEYRKEVAIKLIRRGLDTEDILRRFRNERQILAQLDHPNIARLLDGGTTEDGLPYFVMEYVQGEPIDRYCSSHGLTSSARLELFRKVCAAVTYAHQNLVVHRDLKPSNILVTMEGEPKLLDFGIAKLLSAEESAGFTMTLPEQRVLTRDYASPEQIRGERITTASDIYSLGVLLYELLAGEKPYRLKTGTSEELTRAIAEQEPARPKSLPGDLANIVSMAMRKEPTRRYASVGELSEDIRRYLAGRPIAAHRDSLRYRAGKFVRRNRAGVIAAAVVFFALIAGMAGTIWQAHVADRERDRAKLEAEKVKKINAYTQKILNFSNASWLSSNPARNRNATIAEALDEATKNIDTDLGNEPEIQAEVLITLGMTYNSQTQYDKAEKAFKRAIENLNRIYGGENLRASQAQVVLTDVFFLTGRNAEMEKLARENVDYFRAQFAGDKTQAKWLAPSLHSMGLISGINSKLAEAERLYREALTLEPYLDRQSLPELNIVLASLASTLQAKGDFQGAKEAFDRALAGTRAAGNEENEEGALLYLKAGNSCSEMGDYAEADRYYQKAYPTLLRVYGAEHFYTAAVIYQMANIYFRQGRIDEAEKLVGQSLDVQRKIFPNGHFLTAISERLLGEILTQRGDPEKGEGLLRKALSYLSGTIKEPNRHISGAKLALGENLMAQREYDEAKALISSALDASEKVAGENHPFTGQCREALRKIPK